MRTTSKRIRGMVAGAAALAIVLSACASGTDDGDVASESDTGSDEGSDDDVGEEPTDAATEEAAAGPWKIFLSNNFVGNEWRQQMQKTAEVAATKEPFVGQVDFQLVTSENTVEAQISDLENMIDQEPDAILIDAGSPDGLNSTIQRACDAGIIVVSFDQTVTAECAYKVMSDWELLPRVVATWLAEAIGGEGKVVLDRGLAGTPLAEQMVTLYDEVLAEYPGIEVAGYFNGDFAYGPELEGVASLLAANPDVVGATTDNWGSSALQAFIQAGKERAAVTGYGPNGALVECAKQHAENPDYKCFFGANGPELSAEAMKVAVDVLNGDQPHEPGDVLIRSPFYTTDVIELPGFEDIDVQEIVLGENAFEDLPPSLGIPWSPQWMEILPEEVAVQ